jgi:hypothetical protein
MAVDCSHFIANGVFGGGVVEDWDGDQGGQIGRILDYLAIIFFGQFFCLQK